MEVKPSEKSVLFRTEAKVCTIPRSVTSMLTAHSFPTSSSLSALMLKHKQDQSLSIHLQETPHCGADPETTGQQLYKESSLSLRSVSFL